MFGHAHVNTDGVLRYVLPIERGILDGFSGTEDAHASGPGSSSHVLAFLVSKLVEVADAGDRFSEVPDFVIGNAADTAEQIFTELIERVSIGRAKANARYHHSFAIRPFGNHIGVV